MLKRCVLFFVFFAFLTAQPIGIGNTKELDVPALNISTEKFVLDNGLTVLITEMPSSTSVAVYGLVSTGSATEGKYLASGISHYLEHMLFKGTKTRKVGEIGEEIKSLGGVMNASTGFDYTIYLAELPSEHVEKGIDIISDMLMNATFDPGETASEREVVVNEMRLHNDNPDRQLSRLVLSTAYLNHPYRYPVIGYEKLLNDITRDDLVDYYETHYTPGNMVFSVAGNLKTQEVLPIIKETFKDFKRQTPRPRNLAPEAEQIGTRRAEKEYPTEVTRMSLAYHSVRILDRDVYALDLLASALGRGRSSRLYRRVYDKEQLVHSIYTSNYTPRDPGIFEVESSLDYKNVEKVIAAVKEEISQVQKNGLSKDELAKIKKRTISQFVFDKQRPGDVAYDGAVNFAYTGDYNFSKTYVEGMRNVTNEDIKRVANKYLVDSGLTIAVIKPAGTQVDDTADTANVIVGAIEKVVLDNGVTVLLRQDTGLPLVFMTVAMHAGTRQETAENNGISELTARLWVRETKSKNAEAMAQFIESRGIKKSGFSGKHSFGVHVNTLTQDADVGLNLLEDFVKNPAFSIKEYKKEKEKMKADIVKKNDSISAITVKTMKENLFPSQYNRLDQLGSIESVERISHSDVRDFYKRLAVGSNMVVSVFGNFDKEDMLENLKKRFSSIPGGEVELLTTADAAPTSTMEKTQTSDKKQAMVIFGFHGPKFDNEDRYGLEVGTSVLGSSLSGRMFTEIRDELGLAYTLGAGYVPGFGQGYIYFYANTTKEDVDKVTELIKKQLEELRTQEISDKELTSAQAYIKGTFQRGIETSGALGSMVTLNELFDLGYNFHDYYANRFSQVTKKDVLEAAQKYLDLSNAVIIKTVPEEVDQ